MFVPLSVGIRHEHREPNDAGDCDLHTGKQQQNTNYEQQNTGNPGVQQVIQQLNDTAANHTTTLFATVLI